MAFDVNLFWDTRHKASSVLRAGGDKGLSEEENQAFYLIRIGRLLELIQEIHGGRRPLSILDAGCGRGVFTAALRQCGHHVLGLDSSPNAIEYAKETFGGEFEIADLASFNSERFFDVVICIDVLFHLVEDEQWSKTFCNLASACKNSGAFIFTDSFEEHRREQGEYIVHRSRSDYDSILARNSMRLRQFSPYRFGSNINGFAIATSITWGA